MHQTPPVRLPRSHLPHSSHRMHHKMRHKQNKPYSCFGHVSYTCFGVAHALIAYCINHAGGTSVTICPQYVCDTKHALSNVLLLHTPALHNAFQQVPRYQHHNVRPWRHIHSTDCTTYATLCVFCSNGIHLYCLPGSVFYMRRQPLDNAGGGGMKVY